MTTTSSPLPFLAGSPDSSLRARFFGPASHLVLKLGRLGLLLPLGGACAVAVASLEVAGAISLPLVAVVFLCIYSSYLIDHLAEVEEFDDSMASARSRLLAKRRWFAAAGAVSYASALVLAGLYGGWLSVAGLLLFPLSVVFYATPLLGMLSLGHSPWARVKDIPGVKSVYTSVFWGWLMWFACDFVGAGTLPERVCLTLFMTLSDYVNTVICDFKDLERDRTSGVRTLPIMIGAERTLRLLAVVNGMTLLMLAGFVVSGAVSPMLLGLGFSSLSLAWLIQCARRSPAHHGWIGEAGADAAFVLWLPGAVLAQQLLQAGF